MLTSYSALPEITNPDFCITDQISSRFLFHDAKYKTAIPTPVFFVIDLFEKKYNYLTGSGIISDAMSKPAYLPGKVTFDEFELYNNRIIPKCLAFFGDKLLEDYQHYIFSRSHRFKVIDKSHVHLLFKMIFTGSDDEVNPRLATGLIIDITHFKTDSSIVYTIEKMDGNDIELISKNRVEVLDEVQYIFSEKEVQVLRCMRNGMSSKQIADKFGKSVYTVNNQRKSMLLKTGCKNSIELIHQANIMGVI